MILVNVLFTLFSTLLAFRWSVLFRGGLAYKDMVLEVNPEAVFITTIDSWVVFALLAIYLAIVIGSLKFMWDVRHPKME